MIIKKTLAILLTIAILEIEIFYLKLENFFIEKMSIIKRIIVSYLENRKKIYEDSKKNS